MDHLDADVEERTHQIKATVDTSTHPLLGTNLDLVRSSLLPPILFILFDFYLLRCGTPSPPSLRMSRSQKRRGDFSLFLHHLYYILAYLYSIIYFLRYFYYIFTFFFKVVFNIIHFYFRSSARRWGTTSPERGRRQKCRRRASLRTHFRQNEPHVGRQDYGNAY